MPARAREAIQNRTAFPPPAGKPGDLYRATLMIANNMIVPACSEVRLMCIPTAQTVQGRNNCIRHPQDRVDRRRTAPSCRASGTQGGLRNGEPSGEPPGKKTCDLVLQATPLPESNQLFCLDLSDTRSQIQPLCSPPRRANSARQPFLFITPLGNVRSEIKKDQFPQSFLPRWP